MLKQRRRVFARSRPSGVIVTVSTQAELLSALSAATGGETILLRAGNYGDVVFSGVSFADYVTIVSEDGNRGAVFNSLTIANYSDHIRIDGITLAAGKEWWICKLQDASYIEFLNSEFYTSVDQDWANDRVGMHTQRVDHLLASSNIMHHVSGGFALNNTTNSRFANNLLYDTGGDSFGGGGYDNVIFENNISYNMWPSTEFHPDFIQMMTSTDLNVSKNVIIRNNLFYEGEGHRLVVGDSGEPIGAGVQGIFIKDEAVRGRYENILIENNVVVNSSANGIVFYDDPIGITIRNNTLLRNPNTIDGMVVGGETPQIAFREAGAENCVIENNVATDIVTGTAGVTYNNNYTVQRFQPGESNYYSKLFLNAFSGLVPQDFLPVPGSPVDFGTGLGAQQLLSSIEKPGYYVKEQYSENEIDSLSVTLRAEEYPGGIRPDGPVNFEWIFSDGSTATGAEVTYNASGSGLTPVTLRVAGDKYETNLNHTLNFRHPLLVDAGFDNDLTNAGVASGEWSWIGTPSYTVGFEQSAADFQTGVNNFIKITKGGTDLSGMSQVTISMQIRLESIVSAHIISLDNVFSLSISTSKVLAWNVHGENGWTTATGTASLIDDGNWHHILVSYDAKSGVQNIYFDGQVIGTAAAAGDVTYDPGRNLVIGTNSYNAIIDGQIDNLRIYRGIVTPANEEAVLTALRARL